MSATGQLRRAFLRMANADVSIMQLVSRGGRTQATATRTFEVVRGVRCVWGSRTVKGSVKDGGDVTEEVTFLQVHRSTLGNVVLEESMQIAKGAFTPGQTPPEDVIWEITSVGPAAEFGSYDVVEAKLKRLERG